MTDSDRGEPAPGGRPRTRKGTGRVTVADVARVAGVAPMTVSRALNSPELVSSDMLARVREAVTSTGYVPNRVAGGLASSRSRLVALLVPSIASPIYLDFVQALTTSLDVSGYQLLLGESGYQHDRESGLLDAIVARRPDGIVLAGTMHSKKGRERLRDAGIPVVETWGMTSTPLDMLVGVSQQKVGAAAAKHLHAGGRRRMAIISADDHMAMLRARGFKRELGRIAKESPFDTDAPVERIPAPSTLGAGREALSRLLKEHDLDAVFCTSDMIALGVLTEARTRGLAVPGDLAVIGYGDMNFAPDTDPPLTTVRVDGAEIGRRAARLLLDRADDRPVTTRIIDVGFSLVTRGSA